MTVLVICASYKLFDINTLQLMNKVKNYMNAGRVIIQMQNHNK